MSYPCQNPIDLCVYVKLITHEPTFLKDIIECVCVSRSVVSNALPPNGLQPSRLPCPWDSPGKNTGVDCHPLLQGIFRIQGSNSGLHCRQILYCLSPQGSNDRMNTI